MQFYIISSGYTLGSKIGLLDPVIFNQEKSNPEKCRSIRFFAIYMGGSNRGAGAESVVFAIDSGVDRL
jgi:hypothetical protein